MNSCCLKFRHTWMASSVIRWEQWRCTIKYCDICGTRFITDWCELQKEVPIGAKLGWAMKEGVVGIWQTALPLSVIHLLHFHICPLSNHLSSVSQLFLEHVILVLRMLIHCWIAPGGVHTSILHHPFLKCHFVHTLAVLLQFTPSVKLPPQQFARSMTCDKIHTRWLLEKHNALVCTTY